jgi:hypothetical protein
MFDAVWASAVLRRGASTKTNTSFSEAGSVHNGEQEVKFGSVEAASL